MEIIELFELGTIDLLGEPLLTCAVEQFLGLWNVNQKHSKGLKIALQH